MKKISLVTRLLLLSFVLTAIYPVGYFVLQDNHRLALKYYSMENNERYAGIGGYIINLDESRARYNEVRRQTEKLDITFKRIAAISGNKLTESDLTEKVDLISYRDFAGHYPKKGTVGCSLSHIKAWREFLASDYEFGLFFEDDVIFDPIKLKIILPDILKHSSKWDILNLEPGSSALSLTATHLKKNQKISIYLGGNCHAGAYILNREAALALLSKALPVKMPIDHYLNRSWEFNLIYAGLENPKLVAQNLNSSEISSTDRIYLPNSKSGLGIERWLYRMQTSYINFCYNIGVYSSIFLDNLFE